MVGDEGMIDEDRHPRDCRHLFNPIRFDIDGQGEEDERPLSEGLFLMDIPFIPFIYVKMKRQHALLSPSPAYNLLPIRRNTYASCERLVEFFRYLPRLNVEYLQSRPIALCAVTVAKNQVTAIEKRKRNG